MIPVDFDFTTLLKSIRSRYKRTSKRRMLQSIAKFDNTVNEDEILDFLINSGFVVEDGMYRKYAIRLKL